MTQNITMDMIKELRHKTGVGMSKCKEALVISEGDLEKAVAHLRKAGLTSSVKKEGRETKEGMIGVASSDTDLAIVEINTETDFVASNEHFKEFVAEVAKICVLNRPQTVEELEKLPCETDTSLTVDESRNLLIQKIGENIQIRRLKIIPKSENTSYGIYSHMGGKLLSIVAIKGSTSEEHLAKDIAMHVAAEDPDYLSKDEVPEDIINREKEIASSQVKGKPENIIEKIVDGKMRAYFDQICLLNQKYVKDSSLTVEQFVEKYAKEKKQTLSILAFWRWKIGQ